MPFFTRVMELREVVRARLASLVAADPLQVTLTASTTDGCNIVLAGLGLSPTDEIVTTSAEHFGMLGALSASGARVVVVEPEPDAVLAAVTTRTRLLALSQALWTTGRVLPVAELRAETRVPVLVDGAQSVGAIPVDAAGLDYLTISGQKWLCGPDSTGALVVADPDRIRVAAPSYFSQAGYERRTIRAASRARPLRLRLVACFLARRPRGRARRDDRRGGSTVPPRPPSAAARCSRAASRS